MNKKLKLLFEKMEGLAKNEQVGKGMSFVFVVMDEETGEFNCVSQSELGVAGRLGLGTNLIRLGLMELDKVGGTSVIGESGTVGESAWKQKSKREEGTS